jgi:hypothetical protein
MPVRSRQAMPIMCEYCCSAHSTSASSYELCSKFVHDQSFSNNRLVHSDELGTVREGGLNLNVGYQLGNTVHHV